MAIFKIIALRVLDGCPSHFKKCLDDNKTYFFDNGYEDDTDSGWLISPIEQFLQDKFNAEIVYCNIALLKAGIGAVEELKGLVEIGKKHIEKYENDYRSTTCSERVCL